MDIKITDIEKEILSGMKVGKERETITNHFSGEQVELCPTAVAIYDIITGCNLLESTPFRDELLQTAKSVFMKNWPQEYMKLID